MSASVEKARESLTSEQSLNDMERQWREAVKWYRKKDRFEWKWVYDLAAALNDCVGAIRRERTEIARLRKAIEDAPHHRKCAKYNYIFIESRVRTGDSCNCWKSKALGEQNGTI